jgi:hypothetical protein
MLQATSIALIPDHTESHITSHVTGWQAVTIQTGYSLWRFERVSKWQLIGARAAGRVDGQPGIDPWSVHLGIVKEKVALGQVLLRVFQFSPESTIPPLLQFSPDSTIPPLLQFSPGSTIPPLFKFSPDSTILSKLYTHFFTYYQQYNLSLWTFKFLDRCPNIVDYELWD